MNPQVVEKPGAKVAQAAVPGVALHVIDALNVGGAQELIALLAKFTPPGRRMAVCVLQPCLDVKDRIEAHGVPVYALNRPRPPLTSLFRFMAYVLGGIRDIARIKRELGADVVHGHLSDAEFLGILAGRLTGARKVTITFHTPLLVPERREGSLRNLLRLWAMRLIYPRADRVVAVSDETLVALRDVIGLDPARMVCIVNGVDCDDLSSRRPPETLRRELSLEPGDRVLLNLGRLVTQKSQIHLIYAMGLLAETHPGLKLFIAGDGPDRGLLQSAIKRLSLADRVILLGDRSDVPDLLALSDMVIVSSLWEGTSLSMMESMAAGKPLAVTDIPGNRELLEDGVQAAMFPPADPSAMAEAIARLLADPALCQRLARAAQAKAREMFDIRRVVADYEALWI